MDTIHERDGRTPDDSNDRAYALSRAVIKFTGCANNTVVKLRVTRVVVMAGRIARERADSFLDGELFALGLAYNSSCTGDEKW